MPNTVRAAAEGMPNTSRRAVLAVTGSGLIAALGGLALSARQAHPAPTLSPDLRTAVDDYRVKTAAYLLSLKNIADFENAPDAPPPAILGAGERGRCLGCRA